jgi:hypothetical protein
MERVILSPPSDKHKVLNVDMEGRLTYENPNEADDYVWILVPGSSDARGYHVMSSKYNFYLTSFIEERGEEVFVQKFPTTTWYVDKNGQLYYKDELTHTIKYLWEINGGLYLTPDDHVIENWRIVKLDPPKEEEKKNYYMMLVWCLVLLMIIIFLIYMFSGIY